MLDICHLELNVTLLVLGCSHAKFRQLPTELRIQGPLLQAAPSGFL